jgi:hypothetical protein
MRRPITVMLIINQVPLIAACFSTSWDGMMFTMLPRIRKQGDGKKRQAQIFVTESLSFAAG